jgi:DNA polymerase-4
MNAFFASVEEILHPDLANKPVIIGSKSRRSVVSTANYRARAYGVRSAMPMYKAIKLCPHAIVCDVNFPAYVKFHNAFIAVIRSFTPKVEVVSIDECFVDITDLTHNLSPKMVAKQIQIKIKQETGLKSSIGIAHNKFMAKMGSDYKKPMGITQMYEKDLIEKL